MYPYLFGKYSLDVSLRSGDRNLVGGFEEGPLFAGLLIVLSKAMAFIIIFVHMVTLDTQNS